MQKDILSMINTYTQMLRDEHEEKRIFFKKIEKVWEGYTLQQQHFYYIMPEYEKIIKYFVKPNPALDLMESV